MRLKVIYSFIALTLVLSCAGIASASSIGFSAVYTADNYVDSFTLTNGATSLYSSSKSTNWQTSTSVSNILLDPGKEYTATWQVRNVPLNNVTFGAPATQASNIAGGNPMAFLGQITIGDTTYTSSANRIWQVNGNSPIQYNTNSAGSIWYNVKGGTIAGIYATAAWIGSSADGSDGDGLFTVTAKFNTAPASTPIPAAVWLLGTGLMGLAGIRKKFAA